MFSFAWQFVVVYFAFALGSDAHEWRASAVALGVLVGTVAGRSLRRAMGGTVAPVLAIAAVFFFIILTLGTDSPVVAFNAFGVAVAAIFAAPRVSPCKADDDPSVGIRETLTHLAWSAAAENWALSWVALLIWSGRSSATVGFGGSFALSLVLWAAVAVCATAMMQRREAPVVMSDALEDEGGHESSGAVPVLAMTEWVEQMSNTDIAVKVLSSTFQTVVQLLGAVSTARTPLAFVTTAHACMLLLAIVAARTPAARIPALVRRKLTMRLLLLAALFALVTGEVETSASVYTRYAWLCIAPPFLLLLDRDRLVRPGADTRKRQIINDEAGAVGRGIGLGLAAISLQMETYAIVPLFVAATAFVVATAPELALSTEESVSGTGEGGGYVVGQTSAPT